jgi:hypothetical protein
MSGTMIHLRIGLSFMAVCALLPSLAVAQVPAVPRAMSIQAATDIATSMRRQLQPCFDRQAKPGRGAERIVVTIRLHLNRDGSLATPPEMVGSPGGVDDQDRRYVGDVIKGGMSAIAQCAPFHGLPADLYDVPNGWSNFSLRYKLPG